MANGNKLPSSLQELAHYFEGEELRWQDTPVGTEVVIESLDPHTQAFSYFHLLLLKLKQKLAD